MENEGLKTLWFSTNTSSRKISQIQRDAKACVYFVDFDAWMGLMLVGRAEILQDEFGPLRLERRLGIFEIEVGAASFGVDHSGERGFPALARPENQGHGKLLQ